MTAAALSKSLSERPFFIVGCPRSGTTLLRLMLNSHPRLAVPRESHFITRCAPRDGSYKSLVDATECVTSARRLRGWELDLSELRRNISALLPTSYAQVIRIVFATYAAAHGKERWGDKTPQYVYDLPLLSKLFPDAQFVHVIRDGREVAASIRDQPWGPSSAVRAATWWRRAILDGRRQGRKLGPERYAEIRLERMISAPERTLRELCAFLDEEFAPEMSDYHRSAAAQANLFGLHPHVRLPPTANLRDWTANVSAVDQERVEAMCSRPLRHLDLPVGRTRARARLAAALTLGWTRAAERISTPWWRVDEWGAPTADIQAGGPKGLPALDDGAGTSLGSTAAEGSVTLVIETQNIGEGSDLDRFFQVLAIAQEMARNHGAANVVVLDNGTDAQIAQRVNNEFPDLELLDVAGLGYDEMKMRAARDANTEFVAFLDGDCVPESPEWLSIHLERLRAGAVAASGGHTVYDGGFVAKVLTILDFGFLLPTARRPLGCYASNNVLFRREVLLNTPLPSGPMRCRCYPHAQALSRIGTPVQMTPEARVRHELPPFFRERFRQGYDAVAACTVDPMLSEARMTRWGIFSALPFYLRNLCYDWKRLWSGRRAIELTVGQTIVAGAMFPLLRLVDLAGMVRALSHLERR